MQVVVDHGMLEKAIWSAWRLFLHHALQHRAWAEQWRGHRSASPAATAAGSVTSPAQQRAFCLLGPFLCGWCIGRAHHPLQDARLDRAIVLADEDLHRDASARCRRARPTAPVGAVLRLSSAWSGSGME